MKSRRYVIIGGSAAGMAAAQTIRGHDPRGSITVLSDEGDAPYFRPMIPFIISRKKKADDIFLQGTGPYRAHGIELHLNARAAGIDTKAKLVITANKGDIPFDRLLIATGSRPYLPRDISGLDQKGVFALRSLEDARQAAGRAETASHAVMLGGGLLNLKAAFALLERGIRVTLVVYSPEVLSQLMEPEDAYLIRLALDQAGLRIITGRSARRILGDGGGVTGVVLDDGWELACTMVCIGKGVRPNTGWIEAEEISVDNGVVVDTYTQSSVPSVFAAGDVAVTFDPISGKPITTGLWTNAVEMGRCAGANMAGRATAYGGTFGILNATQVAGMPFVAMGVVHTAGTDLETHMHRGRDTYRKLVFSADGERLLGAVLIGDIANAGLYRSVIRDQKRVHGIKQQIVGHRLHYGHLLYNRGD